MMLEGYLQLLQTNPKLFGDKKALFKIILDKGEILSWQLMKKADLSFNHRPQEWADIGIILNDPYNIILRDLVEFPDGQLRGYTRSIATASLNGGKGVVILPEYEGKILLLHQFRHPTRQWHYEVPRGYGEPNTTSSENARKEIEEETGGVIEELVSLGEFHNNSGYEAASVDLFFARLSSISQGNINEGIESYVWLTVEELEDWIVNEIITDGFTIAAYTKAKLRGLI